MCCFWHFQTYIERLVSEAYVNWSSLEEVDASLSETALLTQGRYKLFLQSYVACARIGFSAPVR